MVWLLPDPVRTALIETTGLVGFDLRIVSAHEPEVGARRVDHGCLVHHVLVRHIAVGKDHLLHAVLLDQVDKLLLGPDGDPAGVQVTGQLRRIKAPFDVRDLGGSEGHDLVVLVAAEERVEVMEITSGRAHDESFDWHRILLSIKPR